MASDENRPVRDQWAEWMLNRRFAGDPEEHRSGMEQLLSWRDRILDNAGLEPGQTQLDVGAGDGLIAFGALDRLGEQGRVIFSDVSQDLLDHSRNLAHEMGVLDRCDFVRAPADDLSAIPDASVDVVTTRSVLIYVKEKDDAFREFFRVLKPGGRISIFEPINKFSQTRREIFPGYDVTGVEAIAQKVMAVYRSIQPEDDPMVDFDERDLLALAEEVGFEDLHLDYEARISPIGPRRWETATRVAGNPKIPTLEEAMAQALTPEEIAAFTAHLRPLVEAGRGVRRLAVAFLWATRPAS